MMGVAAVLCSRPALIGVTTRMRLKKLLRKNIEPRGVVDGADHCRAFRYDPLRRIPPKPAALRGHFTDADFSLGDNDET